jgi:hypothetical protein
MLSEMEGLQDSEGLEFYTTSNSDLLGKLRARKFTSVAKKIHGLVSKRELSFKIEGRKMKASIRALEDSNWDMTYDLVAGVWNEFTEAACEKCGGSDWPVREALTEAKEAFLYKKAIKVSTWWQRVAVANPEINFVTDVAANEMFLGAPLHSTSYVTTRRTYQNSYRLLFEEVGRKLVKKEIVTNESTLNSIVATISKVNNCTLIEKGHALGVYAAHVREIWQNACIKLFCQMVTRGIELPEIFNA